VAYIADGARLNRTERRSFTIDQAKTVLAAIKDERLAAGYEMTLSLGLRLGEVTGLSWDDIDLDVTPPILAVRRQLQRRARKGLVLCDLKTPRAAGPWPSQITWWPRCDITGRHRPPNCCRPGHIGRTTDWC
jgi:integrase